MIMIIKKIKSIAIKTICGIILFIIILYFGLWIYVSKSVPKELKQQYDQINIPDISSSNYEIIWFALTGNKNNGFKWYPFLYDRFFGERNNNIKRYVAFNLVNTNENYRRGYRLETWHIEYGLARYIRYDNNYKKCLSYIINYGFLGNNIYGLINASEYYYNKNINDLTERELISLALLFTSPSQYKIGEIISENKTEEIIYLYKK